MKDFELVIAPFVRIPDKRDPGGAGELRIEALADLQVNCESLANLVRTTEDVLASGEDRTACVSKISNYVGTLLTDYILYSVGCIASIPNTSYMTLRGKVSTSVRSFARAQFRGRFDFIANVHGVDKVKFTFDDVATALARFFTELAVYQSRITRDPNFTGIPGFTIPILVEPMVFESENDGDEPVPESKPALRSQMDTMAIGLVHQVTESPHWGDLTMRERGILIGRVIACLGLSQTLPSGHEKSGTPGKGAGKKAAKPVVKRTLSNEERELADVRKDIRLEKERINGELPPGHPLLAKYRGVLDRIRAAKPKKAQAAAL